MPSKRSCLLRPFKGLFSRCYSCSLSLSDRGAQLITPHNANASISACATTSMPQVNPQGTEYTPNINLSTTPFTSALPTNNATSANPQGSEYTSILELSTTPSSPLTGEQRMNEWGSTAYEGLKMAIQGIYDFSGSFPPLHTTTGVLLTISKVVDVRGSMCFTC